MPPLPVSERPRTREPAGAWLALAACTTTITFAAGARFSFAAFLRPIELDLGLDRATLSNAAALTLVTYGLGSPLAGTLALRFGARAVMATSVILIAVGGIGMAAASEAWHLYLFAGLVPGIVSAGATVVPATVLLAQWFQQRLGMATGIVSSALPAGQAIFVPLAAALIPALGWRSTYVLLGLVLAALAVPILLLFARPPHAAPQVRPAHQPRPRAVPRVGLDVWLIGIGFFTCGFTDQFVALHFVTLAVERGLDPLVAAGFVSAMLIVGIVGSVLSGPVADAWKPFLLLSGVYLLRVLALPLLLLAGPGGAGFLALTLFGLVFGVTYIANQAPGARLVRDHYGVAAVGPLMGTLSLAHHLGGAVGIALGGISVTLVGDYVPSVLAATGVILVGGLLQLLIPWSQRRRLAVP